MEKFKQGFQFFTQDQSRDRCTDDLQRAGYRAAEKLYDQLTLTSFLVDYRDLNSLLSMCGIDHKDTNLFRRI